MSQSSAIEWTSATWNPVTGCTKISLGCENCYAERMTKRLQAMRSPNYRKGFEVAIHPHALEMPLKWTRPQMIFVNSMSDLFHDAVPDDFILSLFDIMKQASWHTFQLLTKRPERLVEINPRLTWPKNVWMGVTIEHNDYVYRADLLRHTGAAIKFLSCEPLLSSLPNLNLTGLDWVIVGGESGPRARLVAPSWITNLRNQCVSSKVPFFFKQWGGVNKKKNGRILEGETWDQMPIFFT